MRILLDECVPARLKKDFPGHAVQSVTQTDWRTSKDGPLLSFAQGRFEVFVTVDRKLEKQNDLSKFKLVPVSLSPSARAFVCRSESMKRKHD